MCGYLAFTTALARVVFDDFTVSTASAHVVLYNFVRCAISTVAILKDLSKATAIVAGSNRIPPISDASIYHEFVFGFANVGHGHSSQEPDKKTSLSLQDTQFWDRSTVCLNAQLSTEKVYWFRPSRVLIRLTIGLCHHRVH